MALHLLVAEEHHLNTLKYIPLDVQPKCSCSEGQDGGWRNQVDEGDSIDAPTLRMKSTPKSLVLTRINSRLVGLHRLPAFNSDSQCVYLYSS